jgi:hypothetical protein
VNKDKIMANYKGQGNLCDVIIAIADRFY